MGFSTIVLTTGITIMVTMVLKFFDTEINNVYKKIRSKPYEATVIIFLGIILSAILYMMIQY